MQSQTILDRLDRLGASALWVVYHDYAGIGRAKAVPRARFAEVAESGVTFALASWDRAVNDHPVPHPGFGPHSGDFRALPDPGFVVPLPHRPGVVQAAAVLRANGSERWPGDPRGLLAAQVARLRGLGLIAQVAFEGEFVLVAAGSGADGLQRDPSRMFAVDELDARWSLGERLLSALETAGIPVHHWAKALGPGQFELSLAASDPVSAADRFLYARQLLRAFAREAGLHASWMPRPAGELPANGVRVHVGLMDASGREALAAADDPASLSPVGRAAVAGLLVHAAAQAALGSPTTNSYKRVLPGSRPVAHAAWSFGNRSALVRVPGRSGARHLEYGAGDGTANPHLMLTGLLASILDGLERRLEPPAPTDMDEGHLADDEAGGRGFARLPDRLSVALEALWTDEVLLEALGPVVPEHYLAVKRFELESYLAESGAEETAAEVTGWERAMWFGAV